MGKKGESRREFLQIQAVDPTTGKFCAVLISYDRLNTVAKRSLGHASECGYIVPAILQKPTAIFEGLRHDEDEDKRGSGWRCYCGVPECSFRTDGTKARPYPGQVYLIFVNDDQIAYNWRWEKSDEKDSTLPINHETRFKRRLL